MTDERRTTDGIADTTELAELLPVLSDRDRRALLLYLVDGNPEDVDDIPEHIRVAEHLDEDKRRELAEMLETEHLPLLEENDLIEWDRQRNVVLRGERFDEIRPLLGLISENRDELPDDWL
jgi:DNA-binding transcriptional ArsR family regulator